MREIIVSFEQKIKTGLRFLYTEYPESFEFIPIELNYISIINVLAFYNTFLEKGIYPKERLKNLIFILFDIKLQMYFIETELIGYNKVLKEAKCDLKNIYKYPHAFLSYLSIHQNMIIKSRVLSERIMSFIYYLETGKELEGGSRKKSKKTLFFRWTESNTKWKKIGKYEEYVTAFDDDFRTPELHKSSILRKWLLENKYQNKRVYDLVNLWCNTFWKNIFKAIIGEMPDFLLNLEELRKL